MSAASFCKKQIRWKAAISDVQVLSHSETLGISDPAIEQIPAAIVAANSADVDIVSGATNTSRGIIAAVKNAMGAEAAAEEPAGKVLQNDVYERRDDMDAEKSSEIYYGGVAARREKYAPVVRTLENGVKVQRTPYDQGIYNNYFLHSDERGCYACHDDLNEALQGDAEVAVEAAVDALQPPASELCQQYEGHDRPVHFLPYHLWTGV